MLTPVKYQAGKLSCKNMTSHAKRMLLLGEQLLQQKFMVSHFICVDIVIQHSMAAWRCKISLLTLKNISLGSLCTPTCIKYFSTLKQKFVSPWSWNILLFDRANKKFSSGRGI